MITFVEDKIIPFYPDWPWVQVRTDSWNDSIWFFTQLGGRKVRVVAYYSFANIYIGETWVTDRPIPPRGSTPDRARTLTLFEDLPAILLLEEL